MAAFLRNPRVIAAATIGASALVLTSRYLSGSTEAGTVTGKLHIIYAMFTNIMTIYQLIKHWIPIPQVRSLLLFTLYYLPYLGAYKLFPPSADYPDLSKHNNVMANNLTPQVNIL